MAIKKLNYDDALMLDHIVDTFNELVDEVEYIHKRIDRLWKFQRMKEKEKKEAIEALPNPKKRGDT